MAILRQMQVQTIGLDGKTSMDIIGFYTQALGSSHLSSGKPCQDNGAYYDGEDLHIAIVCDGHGGESYVRSEIGSKLAAQITIEKVKEFVKNTPIDFFEGKKGTVTTVPTRDPRVDNFGKRRDVSLLSESDFELLKQIASYQNEVSKFPNIELKFRSLFKEIYESWENAIHQHAKENKFSKQEKSKLGSLRIEKAYGTTLMAAVRTPNYWFAFHLGDGKLYCCDKLMRWKEPVPWDCNCFLNVTTSLCDRNPVSEFRYAFDGTGNFPIAFALGSDGIDDTFIKPELIHKFYSQLLCAFNDQDEYSIVEKLRESLSDFSLRGSHDDMSVAAIIDKDELPVAIEYYTIISEVRSLNTEKAKRSKSLQDLKDRIESLTGGIEEELHQQKELEISIKKWWNEVVKELCEKRQFYKNRRKALLSSHQELSELKKELEEKQGEFNSWQDTSRNRVGVLKKQADILIQLTEDKPQVQSANDDNAQTNSGSELCCTISDAKPSICNIDNPNEVYQKANEARMSDDSIAKMDEESDAQAKELLNNKKLL